MIVLFVQATEYDNFFYLVIIDEAKISEPQMSNEVKTRNIPNELQPGTLDFRSKEMVMQQESVYWNFISIKKVEISLEDALNYRHLNSSSVSKTDTSLENFGYL